MKRKWIFVGMAIYFLTGCHATDASVERVKAGTIGSDQAISREMAAKTIALSFYTPQELKELDTEVNFSDVSESEWAYPYICGSVEKGFFSGGEEGDFRPKEELTLWEAQILMDRLAPEYDSRIVLTEENKNMAVSYELWVQLLETSLKARAGTEDCSTYGLEQEQAVILTMDGLCDKGKFSAEGIDLEPYQCSCVTFLEKDGEIVALLSVEEVSPTIQNIYCLEKDGQLLLETGEGAAALEWDGEIPTGIVDVKLENGQVTEIIPAQFLGRCEVKRVDGKEIYLTNHGEMDWVENARIYDGKGEMWEKTDFSDLICGTAAAEYYEKDGKISGAVIREDPIVESIRVFLKGAPQNQVIISAEKGFHLSNEKEEKVFSEEQKAMLTPELPWFDHGIVKVEADMPMQVEFSDGTSYRYEGVLELERREEGIVLINELPIENYLLGVVPYEMPVSFGQTALQAQAITARSYVYHQFYGNTYCQYGGHVTDTVASQVYGGYMEDETVKAAVKATEGLCVVTDGKVAQTYFYSTSCGFGAGNEEVWSKDATFSGMGKSYLKAQSYGGLSVPETEEEWLSFFQDWELEGYDMDSPWYRWKVYFGCGQLSEILQKTVVEMKQKNPAVVSVEKGELSDLGRLHGIQVRKRGKGGVAMELQMTFEKGEISVKTENAIRKVLSPTKLQIGETIYLQRMSGDSLTGNTMLPSGFFSVKEMKNAEGKLTGIALYGGGNGHGVGLSQYGAKKLAESGKTAEEILQCYFPGTTIEKVF